MDQIFDRGSQRRRSLRLGHVGVGMQNESKAARLVNVVLVGAVCLSSGTENMKDNLVQMTELVEKVQSSDSVASWKLWAMAKSIGLMYNYLLPYLPESWIKKLIEYGNHDSAAADQEFIKRNEAQLMELLTLFPITLAQGGVPGKVGYRESWTMPPFVWPNPMAMRQFFPKSTKKVPTKMVYQWWVSFTARRTRVFRLHTDAICTRTSFTHMPRKWNSRDWDTTNRPLWEEPTSTQPL